MNSPPPRPVPQHVPVLTEVIELNEQAPLAPAPVEAALTPSPAVVAQPPVPLVPPPATPPLAEAPAARQLPPTSSATPLPARPATGLPGASADEAQMAQRVLADVQRQIDGMLEYRLREALAPILARASEALVRELRQELSKTMRDVVSRAVAQEVVRQRTR